MRLAGDSVSLICQSFHRSSSWFHKWGNPRAMPGSNPCSCVRIFRTPLQFHRTKRSRRLPTSFAIDRNKIPASLGRHYRFGGCLRPVHESVTALSLPLYYSAAQNTSTTAQIYCKARRIKSRKSRLRIP